MLSNMELVCLGHQKGVGKDTLAVMLEQRDEFWTIAFASKLKDICQDLYGLSEAQLYGDQKEIVDPRYNMSPRTILQRFGTEAVRQQVWDKTWTNYVFEQEIPRMIELGAQRIVITDLRFNNEAIAATEWAASNKAMLRCVKIERPDLISADTHASEQNLKDSKWDFTVINSGTPEDMYREFWRLYA